MAGNYRRPCNVPSHPFSFGVPKEVTDVLAVGLESQESDCTRASLGVGAGRERSGHETICTVCILLQLYVFVTNKIDL